MNYNITAYFIFLALMVFIIVFVGKYFYRNGRIFILALFKGNVELTDHINKILLIAYYLFNIGYAFIKLHNWEKITGFEMLIHTISRNMGMLIFILAIIHYLNMLVIYILSKTKSSFITTKTFQL